MSYNKYILTTGECMNYQKIYDSLIERASNRQQINGVKLTRYFMNKVYGYVEKHHIVPKCMGGSDDETNLVYLKGDEHYVAHQLLVKIYPNNHKLIHAAKRMTDKKGETEQAIGRSKNKLFGWLRDRFSKAVAISKTGTKLSEESVQKRTAARLAIRRAKGIPDVDRTPKRGTKESRALMSRKAKESYENGRELSPSCFKKSETSWNKGIENTWTPKQRSQETKDKISETKRNNPYVYSEETKKKMSESAKNRKKK